MQNFLHLEMCGIHSGRVGCITASALGELSQLWVWMVRPPPPAGQRQLSIPPLHLISSLPSLHVSSSWWNTKSCINHISQPALQTRKREAQNVYFWGDSRHFWIFYFFPRALLSRHLPLSPLMASHAPSHGEVLHTQTALTLQYTVLHSLRTLSWECTYESSHLHLWAVILATMWDLHLCVKEKIMPAKHGTFSFQLNSDPFWEDERDDPWQRMWIRFQRTSQKFLYENTCQNINFSWFWQNSQMWIVLKLHNDFQNKF